jgi:hypothetical protein
VAWIPKLLTVSATKVKEKPTIEVKQLEDDSQQDKCQIKSVLHEPISPYVASSFNTVTALAQGVSLAALFYVISTQAELNLSILSKILVLFLLISYIWYSYLTQNQYTAWRPRAQDTVIPIFLAVTQCLLTVSIRQPIFVFSFFFTLLMVVGFFAALNPYTGDQTPYAIRLFHEHYKDQCEGFAEDFRLEIINFDKFLMLATTSLAIVFSLFTALLYLTYPANELVKSYLLTAFCGLILLAMFRFDFRYYVNHSKKLKKYDFVW